MVTAILSLEYKIGTAAEMGPGYFPLALGIVLTVIGLITLIGGWRVATKTPETCLSSPCSSSLFLSLPLRFWS